MVAPTPNRICIFSSSLCELLSLEMCPSGNSFCYFHVLNVEASYFLSGVFYHICNVHLRSGDRPYWNERAFTNARVNRSACYGHIRGSCSCSSQAWGTNRDERLYAVGRFGSTGVVRKRIAIDPGNYASSFFVHFSQPPQKYK